MKEIGNRIIILGCTGSGKSAFAKQLHECTGLPLYHLDNIWWKKDRTHISRQEFDRKLETILKGEKWIIDGDYSRTFEVRIRSCDTIIVLDYGEEECMEGIIDPGDVGAAFPDTVDDSLHAFLLSVVEEDYSVT